MGGKAPEAVNPAETAQAQFNYNTGSSLASGILNNPNIQSPFGSVSYTNAGSEKITLPDGSVIDVPRYTQETKLGESEQAQKDQRDKIMGSLLGQNVTSNLPGYDTGYNTKKLNTNFSSGAPSTSFLGVEPPQATSLTKNVNSSVGSKDVMRDADSLRFTGGPGGAEDRRRAFEEDYTARGMDLLSTNRDSEVARLAAMGIVPGSASYGQTADQFERSGNDLAIQARLASGQEFQNLTQAENDRRFSEAGLNNSGVNQIFGMDLAKDQFRNDAKTGQFSMDSAQATLEMAQIQMENARKTGDMVAYNSALTQANQAKQQMTANSRDSATFNNSTRQSMINELLGILQGGQIQSPGTPAYQGQGVGNVDYTGLVNNQYQQQVAAYNNRFGGFADIGSALIGALPIPGV